MRLAGVLHRRTNLRSHALPLMRALCAASGETVSLQVRFGDERMCIEQVESPLELRRVVQLGVALPLYPGSTGKALTAFGQHELAQGDVEKLWPEATADEAQRIVADLREVRRCGFAISVNERVDGIAGLAAPIIDFDGAVVAALAVSGPSMRWTLARMEDFSEQLCRAAAEISRQLGANEYVVRRP
jgi:DNA-binding IclR family transcriptional regulator